MDVDVSILRGGRPVLNIGLGCGSALDIFNNAIQDFEEAP
jgi:hypothetical protein